MSKDNLGDRMKTYENVQRLYLTKRMPTIIRIDGKAFHTFTRGFKRPFDDILMKCMWQTAKYLCENIMGCKKAYVQSDEITLLLTDYDSISTQSWFDKNINKMISISASMATLEFNKSFRQYIESLPEDERTPYNNKIDTALFDSRVFNIPKEEVCNNFIWRQQDATRNAIQMVGRAHFSHKELKNKSCNRIQEMLWQFKNINFNDLPAFQKRGVCIVKENYEKNEIVRTKWVVDKCIPIFTQDRQYIEQYVNIKSE